MGKKKKRAKYNINTDKDISNKDIKKCDIKEYIDVTSVEENIQNKKEINEDIIESDTKIEDIIDTSFIKGSKLKSENVNIEENNITDKKNECKVDTILDNILIYNKLQKEEINKLIGSISENDKIKIANIKYEDDQLKSIYTKKSSSIPVIICILIALFLSFGFGYIIPLLLTK